MCAKMLRASKVPNNVYFEEKFWQAFQEEDLQQAKGRVLISCGYVSLYRISRLSKDFKILIARGVTICTFIEKPWYWDDDPKRLSSEKIARIEEIGCLIDTLRRIGVHLTLRPDEHQKVAIIDEKILWDGSLNMLSHNRKHERMRRYTCPVEIQRAIADHQLLNCPECAADAPTCITTISDAEVMSNLVDQFVARRKFLGITQGELAAMARMSQTHLSRIESGINKDLNLMTLVPIARVLGLAPALIPKIYVPSLGPLSQPIEPNRQKPPRKPRTLKRKNISASVM